MLYDIIDFGHIATWPSHKDAHDPFLNLLLTSHPLPAPQVAAENCTEFVTQRFPLAITSVRLDLVSKSQVLTVTSLLFTQATSLL